MNETNPQPAEVEIAREKTKQASIQSAGWTAGVVVFCSIVGLINEPTWPVAAAVAVLAIMVTIICCAILKR